MARHRARWVVRGWLCVIGGCAPILLSARANETDRQTERRTDSSPRPFTVVTYNIQRGVHGPGSLAAIAAFLKDRAPDVVCLQEVTFRRPPGGPALGAAPRIADALGAYDWRAAARNGSSGPVVMVRGTIRRDESISLPGGSPFAALAEVDIGGRRLIVVSVHLASLRGSSIKGAAKTEPARVAQVRHLLKRLERESLPIIVAGDFNALAVFPSCVLVAARFRDVAAQFKDNAYTRKTRNLPARIDYIFVSEQLDARSYAVPPVDHSDHRPVTAELVLHDSETHPGRARR